MINDQRITAGEIASRNVKSVSGSKLTGTVTENKNVFDKLVEFVSDKHNGLIDVMTNTTKGTSGAENIYSAAISGLNDPDNVALPAENVHKQIRSLQKNLVDVVGGTIPDGSITTGKLATGAVSKDKISAPVVYQYIKNYVPNSANNFSAGYARGDRWLIPNVLFTNLITSAPNFAGGTFTTTNGNVTYSGNALTFTCSNGSNVSNLRFNATTIPGHKYLVYCEVKKTTANVVLSTALGADSYPNFAMNNLRKLCSVTETAATFNLIFTATDATTLNGATFVVTKACLIDITADMGIVPFENNTDPKILFGANVAFDYMELPNTNQSYVCVDDGYWIASGNDASTVKVSDATKAVFGLSSLNSNVDKALLSAYSPVSYMTFCTNYNTNSLDAAFGKNNEDKIFKIGEQLAMYAWFKGDSKVAYPFTNLIQCNTLTDCYTNANAEMIANSNITNLLKTSPFAVSKIIAMPELVLYNAGDEKVSTTGGYTSYSTNVTYSTTKNAGDMQVANTTPASWGSAFSVGALSTNIVNTSLYNKVKVEFSAQGAGSVLAGASYYAYLSAGSISDLKHYSVTNSNSGATTILIDIGYFYSPARLFVGRSFGLAGTAAQYSPINITKISLVQG